MSTTMAIKPKLGRPRPFALWSSSLRDNPGASFAKHIA